MYFENKKSVDDFYKGKNISSFSNLDKELFKIRELEKGIYIDYDSDSIITKDGVFYANIPVRKGVDPMEVLGNDPKDFYFLNSNEVVLSKPLNLTNDTQTYNFYGVYVKDELYEKFMNEFNPTTNKRR